MPENWVQHPVVNTEKGSNPGAPLAWGSPENPDDAVAGYGYVPCDTSEVEETFYYHSDHLGSTSYITDQQANVTQYDAYLPYGELLVDEHSSSTDLPYKFNGKELDEETGLYYYGARYMNPVTSMWYGVDPLAEKYVATGAYVYCHGNPIILFDPDGQGDYYINGNWAYSDNKNDGKVYLSSTNGSVTYRNNRFTEWNYSMKSKTFKGILAKTLKLEGGKVNDKADRGGQTNLGITLDTFKRYAQKLLSIEGTSANLDHLQPCQAAKLYEVAYWEKFGANQIEDAQIAELYYDTAVNGGGNAVLRSTLADFGISKSKNPKSDLNKIVMKYGAEFVFEIFKDERIDRYERIAAENPSQKKFLKGWKNRVNSFKYKTAEFQPQPQSVRSKSLTRELN